MFSALRSSSVLFMEQEMSARSCPVGGAWERETKLRVFEHLLYTSPIWAQFLVESDFGPHGQLKSAGFDDGQRLSS